MKSRQGVKSIILFLISLVFLSLLTIVETSLSSLSLTVERIISALVLIVPGVIGVILGATSLRRQELPPSVAILGILLNGLFVLFHLFVLSFAG